MKKNSTKIKLYLAATIIVFTNIANFIVAKAENLQCCNKGYHKAPIQNTYIVISNCWQTPVNLGPPINTPGWEDSPFISPDGNTLYFTYFRVDPMTARIKQKIIVTGPERPSPISLDNKILFFESEGGIYCSQKQADSKWGKREIVVTSSADGKIIVGDPALSLNGDLYFVAAWQTTSGA